MNNSRRKINLLNIITKLELGGAQKNALDILRNLDDSKYNKFLITSHNGMLNDEARNIPYLHICFLSSLKRRINIIFDIISFLQIFYFIKKFHIDIVHTHSSKAGILGRWAAKAAGVNLIVHTVHGWEFHDFQNKFIKWFYLLLEKQTAKITDRIITVSNYDIEKGLNLKIASKEKYLLIRYGIEKEIFLNGKIDRQKKKLKLNLPLDSPIIGMIACFKPQKSIFDFIKTASIVVKDFPNSTFVLIGDGVLRKKIEKAVRSFKLGNNVFLLGWRRDIHELLQIIDIIVLTSLWEGLPYVFLESMASSKPIIASDICASREIISNGISGYVVPARCPVAFASKIITLLRNRDMITLMGKEAFNKLDSTYSLTTMVNQIERVYCN